MNDFDWLNVLEEARDELVEEVLKDDMMSKEQKDFAIEIINNAYTKFKDALIYIEDVEDYVINIIEEEGDAFNYEE